MYARLPSRGYRKAAVALTAAVVTFGYVHLAD